MTVHYLKDEYLEKKAVPIAENAIKQILHEIKALDLNNDDRLRVLRGTICVITALSIDKSRQELSIEDELKTYFEEVLSVLRTLQNIELE